MKCHLCKKQFDKPKATILVHMENEKDKKYPICKSCYDSEYSGTLEMLGSLREGE